MRFDSSKVADFERSESHMREPKTKQVVIDEPQKTQKIETAINDTSPVNTKSLASPWRKSTLVEPPKKLIEAKSEIRSPLFRQKKTKNFSGKDSQLPYVQNLFMQQS